MNLCMPYLASENLATVDVESDVDLAFIGSGMETGMEVSGAT